MPKPMLVLKKINSGYGKFHILFDIDLEVPRGKITVVVGPNGAGKTTLLNTIFGLATIHSGRIVYEGQDITNVPAYKRAKMGMAYTLQLFNIFSTLTVRENLLLATYDIPPDEAKKRMEEVFQLFPRLKERLFQKAGTLSGGERQMLAIAISMLRKPKLMLLDEPTAGLAPKLAKEVFEAIRQLGDQGYTIILAEQNAKGALEIGDEAVVIASGRIVARGKAQELLHDRDLARKYLGLELEA
ncbi:ABC transporter ATP-binding protein [Pyrofollis japonicus]|uniref:ABC transporter ATP-binding protein n=1 Tax=Pyrofollis japonicus TaxID=3060460 RepID=UPI00295BB86B|nr:ABC transporter ATP-binding protein [Pyrofollis japonicus]BEP17788.1 ABC transporter ATP-binding protein [Pyrofollis japonicus]